MNQLPYFPKYAKDWLTGEGTRLMTPEQRGAFDWLLCHAWLSNPPCTLPEDDASLARLSELGRRWRVVGSVIRAQFQPFPTLPGRIYNPKQFAIWSDMNNHRQRRSEAGQKGNAMRWRGESLGESLFDGNAIAKSSPAIGSEDGNGSGSPAEGRGEGFPVAAGFESLWRDYPRKVGREDARRHFDAQIHSRSDLAAIRSAVANYRSEIEILERDDRHVLHGSTFFNGRWKDYVDGTWKAPKPDPDKPPKFDRTKTVV